MEWAKDKDRDGEAAPSDDASLFRRHGKVRKHLSASRVIGSTRQAGSVPCSPLASNQPGASGLSRDNVPGRRRRLAAASASLRHRMELAVAIRHFRKIENQLKQDYPDDYVTIDVETGDFAIGPTGLTAVQNFEAKHGQDRKTFTGHIGST